MPFADVGGLRLHYRRLGAGQPLLLIMGYGTSAALWGEEFLTALARDFDVIAPDNRGTGQSDKPREGYEIATLADDMAGLLDALGLDSVDVAGVSMGGMIAQELVLRHPQRVRRLVLGCTHPGGTHASPADPSVLALIAPQPGATPREAIAGIYAAMTTEETRRTHGPFLDQITEAMLAHLTPGFVLRAQMQGIAGLDTWERLAQVRVPTLVITGDRDVLVPPQNSRVIAERVPGARLAVIPGVAHNFFWEAQAETLALLREFLAEPRS
jgi:3-oxoadipate enol-lactonase